MSTVAYDHPGSASFLLALLRLRPQWSQERLAIVAGVFLTVSGNVTFFRAAAATGSLTGLGGWQVAASLLVAITALNVGLLCLLLNRWTAKPLLTVLLMTTAAAVHFMSHYTVYLDPDMVRNILHTDTKESGELITSGLLLTVFGHGVIPSFLLWRLRLTDRPWRQAVLVRTGCVLVAAVIASGALLMSFQDLSGLMRNHRELRHLITPGNYLVSLGRVLLEDQTGRHQPLMPIGSDARVVGRPADAKPRVLVLVIGETVRAQNWGLNGYARQTTPELARIVPINFRDVTACGSSTEVSVPCMLSPYGRTNYDERRIRHSESLLHVLDHAGIATLWRDNQSGCKGVCDGLPFESFEQARQGPACNAQGCLDEVMLDDLAEVLDQRSGDQVVVLHQLGNHGPAYFKRYPERLRRFAPACETSELGRCSRAEIINAYDNAIGYTDEFLARLVQLLAARTERDAAMIYVSDHGESLGEGGLYLHGVPYAIAPQVQVKVPMVMWFSSGFTIHRGLDTACLKRRAQAPASHDNLFHSVLGLMQVRTSEYQPALDLFHGCDAQA